MSPERLHQLFAYEPDTGLLRWRIAQSSRAKVGGIAGRIHKRTEYIRICVDGVEGWAHRVIWAMTQGGIPAGMVIDHINGDRADNRLVNLRCVTQQVNTQNRRKPSSHNKVGLLGVRKMRGTDRYTAEIKDASGVTHYLGGFATPEEAHLAYMKAKQELHEGVGAQFFNRKAKTTCLEEVQAARLAA